LNKLFKDGLWENETDVMKLDEHGIIKKGLKLNNKLLNGWWVRFLQRWLDLRLHKGDSFAVVHEEASDYE